MTRYVIIGAGAASMGACEAIRSLDRQGSLTVVCEEPEGYYSRPGLAYYVTGEINESQLFPFRKDDFKRLAVQWVPGRAVRLHPQERQVELQTGARLPYDKLLIATGAAAAATRLPGMDLEGVVKLDTLEDARCILRLARKARTAIVVGGGITALEIVEGLVCRKVSVHYFLRGDRYWGNVLDESESRLVEHRLKEDGVHIHFNTELEAVLEKRGRVAGVRTKDGKTWPCELLAVAIGVVARKELGEAAGLHVERGILVDEHLQTSDPDIYAAGDVAQVYDPISGKSVLDSLWAPARQQGTAAGLNMAGKSVTYLKTVAFNVTRLAGLTTTIIGQIGGGQDADTEGIVRGDSEVWRQLPDAIAAQSGFSVNHVRLLVGPTTIQGAILIGDQTLSRPLQRLVADQVDITSIRSRLLEPGAPLAELIADFWTVYLERTRHATQQP
jgi:NAD(P)H-nitrite reductase large subunit